MTDAPDLITRAECDRLIADAVDAEREACAAYFDNMPWDEWSPQDVAKAIRARIKAWPWNGKRISGKWHVAELGETTDYVRGDLFAAQAAELATLRVERDTWVKNDVARDVDFATLRAERDALRKVITEGRRAIGDHFAPHDCYATGPMTGDPVRDLVQCPACSFIAMHDEALKGGDA